MKNYFNILLCLSILFPSLQSDAKTFSVTSNADNGIGTLRRQLLNAENGDSIVFDSNMDGKIILLSTERLYINKNLTIVGNGTFNTILDGNGNFRLFEIEKVEVEIENMTLQHGYTHTGTYGYNGGAILNLDAQLSLRNVHMINNIAKGSGGAIINLGSNGKINLHRCFIAGNTATLSGGGGISIAAGELNLINSVVSGNTTQDNSYGYGGGIVINASTTINLTNSTISGNYSSTYGGGIFGEFNAVNCIIWDNDAQFGDPEVDDVTGSISHTTIRLINLTGNGNFNGTLLANKPFFIQPITPDINPKTGGDFRLSCNSVYLDKGDNTANSNPKDLAMETRIADGDNNNTATIDLGAFERNPGNTLVSNPLDKGMGSFRNAVACACDGDTILFDPGVNGLPIILTGGHISTTKKLNIHGNSINNTLIDGNGNSRILYGFNGATLNIKNLTVQNGQTSGSNGGGIAMDNGELNLDRVKVTNCQAINNATGGGIYLSNTKSRFINCIITGNLSKGSGGGIIIRSGANLTTINTLIAGNAATNKTLAEGGGVYVEGSSDYILINTTVANNYAGKGFGGIFGGFDAVNCIVWGNTAPTYPNANPNLSNAIVNYSLFKDWDITAKGVGNLNGELAANNPLFVSEVPPSDQGSINGNYRLQCTSPLIDIGDNISNVTSADLDGNERTIDGDYNSSLIIDLGAFESLGTHSEQNINIKDICRTYTSPSGNYIWTQNGDYLDTLMNSVGCDSVMHIKLNFIALNTNVSKSNHTLNAAASQGSFQWLNCDDNWAIINGETNASFTPNNTGNYAVEINNNNCKDTSSCQNVIGLGIEDRVAKFDIYAAPNPTTGKIYISFKENQSAVLTITDNVGRQLAEHRMENTDNYSVNLNNGNGLYLLKFRFDDGKTEVVKVLKVN